MIRSAADLVAAKCAYKKAGFVYKGARDLGDGRKAHIWEDECPARNARKKRTSRRRR